LVNDEPLLVNTLNRLAPLVSGANTLILTNASLVDAISRTAPLIPRENIIAEPKPAGTAAALTWAAQEIQRRSGGASTMLCVHADWAIADDEGFRQALIAAETAANLEHALVTVGVVPTRPDPGFGYIQPGEKTEFGARMVERFVEKPDRERAASMMHDGYLWNSGIFVWRVADFLDEVRAHTPEVADSLARNSLDLDAFFNEVKPISVDVGVLERTSRVRVIPGNFGWDDVGTWGALRRVKTEDASGNVSSGKSFSLDAKGNVIHAEGNAVILYGVSDLVVITRGGLTVVTTTDKSADLKTLIDALPEDMRETQ
jgi:mannose-1-phosphate guanylyltransferase